MDLTPYVQWIVFVHVAGAFVFAAAHAVSMYVVFQVRVERDRARIASLLDLSARSLGAASHGLLVVLISGIVAGIVLGSFGRGWIWVSLALVLGIGVLMNPIGGTYMRRLRDAVGAPVRPPKPGEVIPPKASDADIRALLSTRRPEALLALGAGGFLVILYLMYFRPV